MSDEIDKGQGDLMIKSNFKIDTPEENEAKKKFDNKRNEREEKMRQARTTQKNTDFNTVVHKRY